MHFVPAHVQCTFLRVYNACSCVCTMHVPVRVQLGTEADMYTVLLGATGSLQPKLIKEKES